MSEQETKAPAGGKRRLGGAGGRGFWSSQDLPLQLVGAPKIDYKDVKLLGRFISGTRQSCSVPHHGCCFDQEAARIGCCHQARLLSGPALHQRSRWRLIASTPRRNP